jgi:hypothetical protein
MDKEILEVNHAIAVGMIEKFQNDLMKSVADNVNHPQHYTQGGIETIDYLQAKMTKEQFEGYLLGNILKYVSRYPHKNGVEDLQKAEWYIDKLIGVIENE